MSHSTPRLMSFRTRDDVNVRVELHADGGADFTLSHGVHADALPHTAYQVGIALIGADANVVSRAVRIESAACELLAASEASDDLPAHLRAALRALRVALDE